MSPVVKQEIERLIINWGYWMSGGGELAGGIMLSAGGSGGDAWHEPRMSIIFGEARLTHKAMEMLTEPQQMVLKAHYLTNLRKPGASADDPSSRDQQDRGAEREGDQASMKSEQLGLSRRTFYRLLANSQKSFWYAFQLVKTPPLPERVKSLDDVARMSMIPATVA